jgi:hypothetical protein
LYGQLYAAAALGGGIGGWWPVAPLPTAIQALFPVDPAWALGLVVALGVWLAGYGPWRLARVHAPGAGPAAYAGAAIAAFVVQTCPVVLRAIPGVDLAALAVGPIALGLAHPRLAWIAGLWSGPGAATFLVAGVLARRPWWLLAGVPALALLGAPSGAPAAMVPEVVRVATAPAYVTEAGATFPMPPGEQTAIREAAELTRTGLWIPAEVAPTVRGNLFVGPPPTPGTGRRPGAGDQPGFGDGNGQFGGQPGGAAGLTGGQPGGAAGLTGGQPGGEAGLTGGQPGGEAGLTGGQPGGEAGLTGGQPGGAAGLTGGQPGGAAGLTGGQPGGAAEPAEEERPWFGALLVPLQRLHGGAPALFGAIVLIATRGRRTYGAATLAAIVLATLVFGWQDAPGEAERNPTVRASLYLLLDAGALARLPGGSALAWAAVIPALGSLGLATLVTQFARGGPAFFDEPRGPVVVAVTALLAGIGVPLENPRMVAPVTAVPPDPVREALTTLEPGRLLVFPAPQWPYLQGQRPGAAIAWEAALAGQQLDTQGDDPAGAALVGALTALTGVPVDVAAAQLLWESREEDPLKFAAEAGWRYLLVDLDALPPLGRPRLDGWLAQRAGMPVARDGARLLYDLSAGPAGAGVVSPAGAGPQLEGGQPALPPLEGGEPALPPLEGGQPALPPLEGGEPALPPLEGGEPALPPLDGG